METPIDGPEQPVHLLIGRWHRLVEQQAPAVLDRDAVEHERMLGSDSGARMKIILEHGKN